MEALQWTDDELVVVARAGKLMAPHVARMSSVSRRWKTAMSQPDIWEMLLSARFPEALEEEPAGQQPHPRDVYRRRHFDELLNSWLPNLRWVLGYAESLRVGTVCGLDKAWLQHSAGDAE
jgi:hypothetical protein